MKKVIVFWFKLIKDHWNEKKEDTLGNSRIANRFWLLFPSIILVLSIFNLLIFSFPVSNIRYIAAVVMGCGMFLLMTAAIIWSLSLNLFRKECRDNKIERNNITAIMSNKQIVLTFSCIKIAWKIMKILLIIDVIALVVFIVG